MITVLKQGPCGLIFRVDENPGIRVNLYKDEEDINRALDFNKQFPTLPGTISCRLMLALNGDRFDVINNGDRLTGPQIRNKLATSLGIKVDKNLIFKNKSDATWFALKGCL